MKKRSFRRLIRTEIVLIYLVIIAGSVVRMTGSGMGCPDWPKCFGYLVPPTEESQVLWKEYTEFEKGRIIVHGDKLFVAKYTFNSSDSFETQNWEAYTKHDYAIFNPFHTWTEYINRLLGALSGIPMLLLLFISLYRIRTDLISFGLALLGLLLLGFEAWLGKLVVDGNLIPGQISLHMFGALSIVATLMALLVRNSQNRPVNEKPALSFLLPISIVLLLVQIYLGTQLREAVDILAKEGQIARDSWIDTIGQTFLVHRSFSWLLLISSVLFFWKNKHLSLGKFHLVFTLSALFVGVILAYAGMPPAFQPIHLLLAAIFFGWLFYHSLRIYTSKP